MFISIEEIFLLGWWKLKQQHCTTIKYLHHNTIKQMSGIKLSNDNNAGVTVRELTRLERIGAHSHIRGLGLDGKSFFFWLFGMLIS